ncbi:hypothetical protein ACFFU9_00305 [Mariniflexile ostreae]|uniref:Uncharacterized protein n=1 Tax=Mariniflexile ostreae TaxID=1520892 RepID=A0ABV5F6U5_9FLAO
MKNAVLITLVLFLGGAITAQTGSAVTLNINLHPIQTLKVNTTEVDLVYDTAAKYESGVDVLQPDHLTVSGTAGMVITVKSDGHLMHSGAVGLPDVIAANTIQVAASAGTTNAFSNATYAMPFLSSEEAIILSNSKGGGVRNISITYKGAGANTYNNMALASKVQTVFKTQVTYTVTAQ